MNRPDLESLLHELGRLPVESPDELTVARIESRWRASAGLTGSSRGPERRSRRRVAIGGAVALVAAAASVAAVVGAQRNNDPDLVVDAANDVTVELPDGSSIEAQAGEVLPEGAVVVGGPGASGVIGTVFVGPGSAFVVRGGRLVASGAPAPDDPSSDTPPTSTSGVVATTAAPPSSAQGATASTRPTTSPTTDASPRTTSRARPKPRTTKRLSVSAQRTKPTVRISWVAPTNRTVVRYVVVRARKWNGRTLPQGRRIATVRAGGTLTAVDKRPADGQFYVVAAFGPGNQLLAIGSVSTPPG